MEEKIKKLPPSCESCLYHAYDEDFMANYCERMPDEDEMARYSFSTDRRCPFYQFNDEHINVRKQI